MGYTQFTLEWAVGGAGADQEIVRQDVAKWIAGNEEAQYALNEDGTSNESAKWYDCLTDLRELSALLPNVWFVLHGYGEESGDIWRAYAKAGKVEKVKAEFKFKVPGFFKLKH